MATATANLLLTETVLGLAAAAQRLPPARGNRPVNSSTIWRWIKDGIKLSDGTTLRLEAVRLSGRWLTSVEALARFIDAQTPDLGEQPAPIPRSVPQRRRAHEWADAELQRRGC